MNLPVSSWIQWMFFYLFDYYSAPKFHSPFLSQKTGSEFNSMNNGFHKSNTFLAITRRWISFVPSPMAHRRWSRYMRSTA
jgi:hypothetical protein